MRVEERRRVVEFNAVSECLLVNVQDIVADEAAHQDRWILAETPVRAMEEPRIGGVSNASTDHPIAEDDRIGNSDVTTFPNVVVVVGVAVKV